MAFVTTVKYRIRVNGELTEEIIPQRGLRQGDPLSPILFNFAVDCLAGMVRQGQNNGLLCGLASNLIDGGVVIL